LKIILTSDSLEEKAREQKQEINQEQVEGEQNYNETIVTLRLPKKYYKTAYAVSHLLGFKSFDEYVSYAVIRNVFMEIDGAGSITVDGIETQQLLEE
jgi:hypothetical protein